MKMLMIYRKAILSNLMIFFKLMNFRTLNEINKFRIILKSEFATSFNSNLLKIALNFTEDRIAALIVARYPVLIDETVITFSVS